MAKTKPTKLEGELAAEVSIVPVGANKRQVALTKSDGAPADELSIVKAVLEVESTAEGEGTLADVCKGLSEQATTAIKAAVRILEGFKDELPDDVSKRLARLAKLKVEKSLCDATYVDLVTQVEALASIGDSAAIAKMDGDLADVYLNTSLSMRGMSAVKAMSMILAGFAGDLTKEARGALAKEVLGTMATNSSLYKEDGSLDPSALPESADPLTKALFAEAVKQRQEQLRLAKELVAAQDAALLKSYEDRVRNEKMDKLPGVKASELAVTLRDLRKSAPDVADRVEPVLRAASEAVASAVAITAGEIGAGTQSNAPESAYGVIKQRATELVKQGVAKSVADGIAKVAVSDRDLYNRYLAERS